MTAFENCRARQAAEYLRISQSNLAKRRVSGSGPVFSKLGRIVVYRRVDLDAWLSANSRASTSEA
jgi:hypothetical protein